MTTPSSDLTARQQATFFSNLQNRAFPDHPLPPQPVKVREVADAIAAYNAARDAYEADRRRSGTTMSEYAAQEADKEAYVASLEAGKKADPGTKHHDQWRKERADHLRKVDALAEIASRREKELREAVNTHRDALIATYRQAVAERAEKVMVHLDALARDLADTADLVRLREWSETFPNWPGRARTWGRPLIVDRHNGNAITSDDLLAGIRSTLAEVLDAPEPPTNAAPTDPPHITADVTGKALAEAGPVPDDEAA